MIPLNRMKDVYGPWAVVTGASSGIGASLARALAAAGLSVVLIARRVERMNALAAAIAGEYSGVETRVIGVDLTSGEEALEVISAAVAALDIGLVVNNAGVEVAGDFVSCQRSDLQGLIALNVQAYTAVTHFFGRMLLARTRNGGQKRRAGMIMMSSITASIMPCMAVYSASKAFASALAVSLRAEWAPHRVDVTVVEAGVVSTDMATRVNSQFNFQLFGFFPMDLEKFTQATIHAFLAGKTRTTSGLFNRITRSLIVLLPDAVVVPFLGYMTRKMRVTGGRIDGDDGGRTEETREGEAEETSKTK